jgi:hypothetical protein
MLKYTCKYRNNLASLVKKPLKKHYGKAFADKTMHRENTLAGGGKICEYWYVGDKVKDPK